MLFNSYPFLFLFLPATLAGFFSIARYSRPLAGLWLFAASLFFYGWWNPAYVGLLLASILFNYAVGQALVQERASVRAARRRIVLAVGVTANLCLLAYYKYANFLVENSAAVLDLRWHLDPIVLPLGISFFTFTQIAFLVDAARGEVKEANFVHYGLFVTYFPHLIAGPILHHKEMMPQFAKSEIYRIRSENFSVGLTIFALGLFKKVVLADGIAAYAIPVFDNAALGSTLTLIEAWGGALAYTFQLYFDFSGYSDMAIGLSRLFGVKLPLNFNSPYKAVNIIEFWRRWHMTLSRFLRDYVYFALGGNRNGPTRRYLNLLATMLLGGLWHGAGWTFVFWGALHGVYLIVNHAWHRMRKALRHDLDHSTIPGRLAGTALTFLAVVVAWVFFRARDFDAALSMLGGMVGRNGLTVPGTWSHVLHWRLVRAMESAGVRFGALPAFDGGEVDLLICWIAVLAALAWFAPNTQQFLWRYSPALERISAPSGLGSRVLWSPIAVWAWAMGLLGAVALMTLTRPTEFLYFQF